MENVVVYTSSFKGENTMKKLLSKGIPKSTLTILYLSGEQYTIDNVVDYDFTSSSFSSYYPTTPINRDDADHVHIHSYDKKRKADVTQRIPTADIELLIIREKGGRKMEAIRLHRKKGEGSRVYMDI